MTAVLACAVPSGIAWAESEVTGCSPDSPQTKICGRISLPGGTYWHAPDGGGHDGGWNNGNWALSTNSSGSEDRAFVVELIKTRENHFYLHPKGQPKVYVSAKAGPIHQTSQPVMTDGDGGACGTSGSEFRLTATTNVQSGNVPVDLFIGDSAFQVTLSGTTGDDTNALVLRDCKDGSGCPGPGEEFIWWPNVPNHREDEKLTSATPGEGGYGPLSIPKNHPNCLNSLAYGNCTAPVALKGKHHKHHGKKKGADTEAH